MAAALYLCILFRARLFISFKGLHLLVLSHTNSSDGFTCILLLHASLEKTQGWERLPSCNRIPTPTALMCPSGKNI